MRIAFLTHEPFFPPSGGGSAEAVYLVEEFVRRGHELHLFCPRIDNAAEVARRFRVQLHEFTAWKMGRYTSLRNFKYLLYPFFLERMVRRSAAFTAYDLIFSQHAISAVAAGRLKQRLGSRTVTNFLDYLTGFMETWPAYVAPPPLLGIMKRFELSIPKRYGVDGVLTVSETLADMFANDGVARERLLSIHYGFDAGLFPFRPPQKVAPTQPATIVMHGSFDQHHLRDIAVEAMACVLTQTPGVRLLLVGKQTATVERFLYNLRARVPAAQVDCTGFLPYSQVAQQLSGATLGIVPYEESSGTHCAFVAKIVEYLAVGLPVVSTPLHSAKRYFSYEPMVRFSEFDGRSFAGLILAWLREPLHEWTDRARQASDRVRRELDWRAIASKAVDFTERVHSNSQTS